MVVPGGTVGVGSRVAGGLLALGAVLALVSTFLPIYRFGAALTPESAPNETTIGAWVITSGIVGGQQSSRPAWTTGGWLVLVALVAVVAAVFLFATARRPGSRARTFAAFAAGILAAAAVAQCLPAVAGLVSAPRPIYYHVAAGWVLLVLVAISATAGGTLLSAASSGAAPMPGPWGGPPPAWPPPPLPPQWPQTGPFPAQQPPPPGRPPRA